MAKQLLNMRLAKVADLDNARPLLAEEKYVYETRLEFERIHKRFTDAISSGQSSVFTLMQKNQMEKLIIVRFLRPMGEIIGFDLNKYGPFKMHDVAELPAANAEVLIVNGDASRIYPSDSL